MVRGQRSVVEGARSAFGMFLKNPVQFLLAVFLVMSCGAVKKFQTFPMPWIAGQSKCMKVVEAPPSKALSNVSTAIASGTKVYAPTKWLETKTDCSEKAKVFLFVTESFTITTAYLVFFGVVKAVFNFVTGVCCDRFGRKWTLFIGWLLALPMPFMVIYANSWWTAATSNIFLGMIRRWSGARRSSSWSTTWGRRTPASLSA
mmetsp:Transcript_15472/g.48706  ORF Transcript_15472/g.48706 Transcript_15472/m.48706 type:complete len:202 (+) Transcript_15472:58-663(+)